MGSEAGAGHQPAPMAPVEHPLTRPYLDVCKRCLTRGSYRRPTPPTGSLRRAVYQGAAPLIRRLGFELVLPVDPAARDEGRDFVTDADTMIGIPRLENLQACVVEVLRDRVPGDLIETGVWRGGASIFMRAVLRAYGITDRTVWVADSFQGLPKPDAARYPADAGDELWRVEALAVSLDQVKANFAGYGLLDDQVRFLPGWFRDTLPAAPIEQLAVLRLDGDLYESTMDALTALYPRLSVGGYVIVDDYGALEACRTAVGDFRAERGITDDMVRIDWTGVFWRRSS
jgi:O-methyltransferase